MSQQAIETGRVVADLLAWQVELSQTGQRDIVVLEGDESFTDAALKLLISELPGYLLISERLDAAIPAGQASNSLGQEATWVILDLHRGLDADVFCIATGLVRAGGILLLLWPGITGEANGNNKRLLTWQDDKTSAFPWFEQYLMNDLRARDWPGSWLSVAAGFDKPGSAGPVLSPTPFVEGCTVDQLQFLIAARQWLAASQAGVFLLLADRGRGKSTVLGLLCDELQRTGQLSIVVTAPSRQAAAMCLQRAPAAHFMAPDALLQAGTQAELVLVDEAAMIPQSVLRQICKRYSRVILATTTGGYEGTGQGFLLRFRTSFKKSELRESVLQAPVRWCDGDRLERWVNETLMPSIRMEPEALYGELDLASVDYSLLQPGQDSGLIRQAYTLLSHAHYRTAPADLQMMMENPDISLLVARREGALIAAALVNREGGFDEHLCDAVFLGQRRPRGHLLAQLITAQTGARDFAGRRGLRIQRIAVTPEWRRRGIGSALLEQVRALAASENHDYLGASFALDSGSTAFWSQAGFQPVAVSFAQGKSSGSHSLAVVLPLQDNLSTICRQLSDKLQRQLPQLMLLSLQSMEAEHVVALLRYLRYEAVPDALEKNDVRAFIEGERGLESCFVSLQKQVMQAIARSTGSVDELLVYKAVLHRNWSALPRQSGSEGRRQLQQRLRGLVEALLKDC